jgi:hypothetical protein
MRHFKLATICAVFVLAVSMSAFAGSVNNFSGALTGVSNSQVSGWFSFNSQTDQFSNVSISFASSILGNGNASPGSVITHQGPGGQWWFQWWGFASNGDIVAYKVTLNANGTFQATGGIADWQGDKGMFNLSVPEGGTRVGYLMLSAIAVFGGIFISSKQRRGTATDHSS